MKVYKVSARYDFNWHDLGSLSAEALADFLSEKCTAGSSVAVQCEAVEVPEEVKPEVVAEAEVLPGF